MFLISLMFGCRSFPKDYQAIRTNNPNSYKSSCNELYAEIKEKWAVYSYDNSCYFHNQKLMNRIIEERSCLIGLSVVEMKEIFGEPSNTSLNNFDYSLSKDCSSKDTYHTEYYTLKFVAIDTVEKIKYFPVVWID